MNPTDDYQARTVTAEVEQENDIQRLVARFAHVDENVVYATYFEQADGKYEMACGLLSAQFPVDPAYKAQRKEEE